jgi:hypothetical protein
MEKEMTVVPFISVGEIKFGMTKNEVLKLFDKEPKIFKDFLKRTNLFWDYISVILDKKGFVCEITISENEIPIIYDGKNLFKNENIIKVLNKIEKPINKFGYRIYLNLGIGFLDWNKNASRAITIFAKELIEEYKK